MNDIKENSESSKIKLLFIEDDKVTIDVVKRLFKNKYNCDCVLDGESALIKAKENDYDVFLIDIGLPGKFDGIQTTKELKKIKNNSDKPYVAITAFAMAQDKEFFLSEGLTHYISKPFEFKALLELIDGILAEQKKLDIE